MSGVKKIVFFISFNFIVLIFFKSDDLINELINSKKALLKPLLITVFLLKLFSNGSEISISSIWKALAIRFVVEKNIFKARTIKKIYKLLK